MFGGWEKKKKHPHDCGEFNGDESHGKKIAKMSGNKCKLFIMFNLFVIVLVLVFTRPWASKHL